MPVICVSQGSTCRVSHRPCRLQHPHCRPHLRCCNPLTNHTWRSHMHNLPCFTSGLYTRLGMPCEGTPDWGSGERAACTVGSAPVCCYSSGRSQQSSARSEFAREAWVPVWQHATMYKHSCALLALASHKLASGWEP